MIVHTEERALTMIFTIKIYTKLLLKRNNREKCEVSRMAWLKYTELGIFKVSKYIVAPLVAGGKEKIAST